MVVACGHWVTPEVEDRRYDTRFFVAALPDGQHGDEVIGEADRAGWWRPADALAAYAEGQMAMLPPTVASLQQLAGYSTVAEVRADVPDLGSRPQMPRPVADGHGGVRWVMVDAHTGEVLAELGAGPAGSEMDGAG